VIERISGKLLQKTPTLVHLELGSVCLEVSVPLSTSQKLPQPGESCSLWSHLVWREDGPSLFGFLTRSERELFRLLILVQGIGPRIACSVLSHLSPPELARQIRDRSLDGLVRVPGIGSKTAGRILVELGPRVDRLDLSTFGIEGGEEAKAPSARGEDAIQALAALGYAARDARAAVGRVLKDDPAVDLDDCIRRALRVLAGS